MSIPIVHPGFDEIYSLVLVLSCWPTNQETQVSGVITSLSEVIMYSANLSHISLNWTCVIIIGVPLDKYNQTKTHYNFFSIEWIWSLTSKSVSSLKWPIFCQVLQVVKTGIQLTSRAHTSAENIIKITLLMSLPLSERRLHRSRMKVLYCNSYLCMWWRPLAAVVIITDKLLLLCVSYDLTWAWTWSDNQTWGELWPWRI